MYLYVGGDRRSFWTVRFLREQGIPVGSFHVPGLKDTPEPSRISVLILPFPVPHPMEELPMLLSMLTPNATVFCGKPGTYRDILSDSGAKVIDLYDTEPLTTLNAAATAEGALHLLIGASEITLAGSRCLVIGSGRIGMLLGGKLRSLGAEVTVSARSEKDRAMIRALDLRSAETGVYSEGLSHYDFIINTVPAPVLNRAQLSAVKKDCILLELASAPGGFSPTDCDSLGLHLIHGPGLPGRFSPKTAGLLYGESLMIAMKKEGIL